MTNRLFILQAKQEAKRSGLLDLKVSVNLRASVTVLQLLLVHDKTVAANWLPLLFIRTVLLKEHGPGFWLIYHNTLRLAFLCEIITFL